MDKVHDLLLERIYRNPKQPRKTFDGESLAELAASIKEHGVIEPIIVEPIPSPKGDYMLVAGERRWRASKIAGMKTIRAIMQEHSNHNGRERLILGLVENIQREDMNAIEEAEAYQELKDTHGMKVSEIARKVGKAVSQIYIALQRLELQPKVRELMRQGKLQKDSRVVNALISIEDASAQAGLAQRAIEHKMTVPAILAYAKRLNAVLQDDGLKRQRAARSPAMKVSQKKYSSNFDDETAPPRWNALVQFGKALPWSLVVMAANATCARCELRNMASNATCGNCPAVDMLGQMAQHAEEVKS